MSGSSSVPYSPKCLEYKFSEVHGCGPILWAGSQGKNSTRPIKSRLTNARAQHTKKKIDSKVRYDSWLLK